MKANEQAAGNLKSLVELKATQSARQELCEELGISEADTGGKAIGSPESS